MCLTNDEYMLKVMSRFYENVEEKKALHAMQHVLHFHRRLITAALASNVTAEEVSDHTLHNDDSHLCMYDADDSLYVCIWHCIATLASRMERM